MTGVSQGGVQRRGWRAGTKQQWSIAPMLPPPASQCPSKTNQEDQLGEHSGIGVLPRMLELSSVPPQEKTCIVSQLCQYFSAPGPQGNELRSEKMTSGSKLHWCGVAKRTRGYPQNGPMRSTKGV
jgi:hypothetical protein